MRLLLLLLLDLLVGLVHCHYDPKHEADIDALAHSLGAEATDEAQEGPEAEEVAQEDSKEYVEVSAPPVGALWLIASVWVLSVLLFVAPAGQVLSEAAESCGGCAV